MLLRNLFEQVKKSFRAYHGSNDKGIKSFRGSNEQSSDKRSAIFFTDSIDYAKQHGNYVYEVELYPEKILSSSFLRSLSEDDIISVIQRVTNRESIDDDLRRRVISIVNQQIQDYEQRGNVSGLFEGLGGFRVLRELGIDMISIDNGGETFYLVLDSSIIKIIDMKNLIV